jgi:hypothetical protein
MAKRVKLPQELRDRMIDLISSFNNNEWARSSITFCPKVAAEISDSFPDPKIIQILEQTAFWISVGGSSDDRKILTKIQDDLADYLLLEELNKEVKRGKKNSSG